MSDGDFDPARYPVAGTHVSAPDGDVDSLATRVTRLQAEIGGLAAESLRVRDQHRQQLVAISAEVDRLRRQTFTVAEVSCLVKQAVRKRDERRAVNQPVDVLDSAIAKLRADLAEAGVADPTGGS